MRRWLTLDRVWDGLALLAIAFVLWKVFIAPRNLDAANAHPAPRAAYERLDGSGTFRIADQRGRLLFLDFYASWCEPCRIELPQVQEWALAHPDAVVAMVDVGEPHSVAEKFARQYHLHNVVLDPHSTAQPLFAVEGFPTLVVVDPQGRIRASWQGLNPAIALAMSNARKNLTP